MAARDRQHAKCRKRVQQRGLRHARKRTATKTQGRGGGRTQQKGSEPRSYAQKDNSEKGRSESGKAQLNTWGQRRNSTPGWATFCSAARDTSATPTGGTIERVENSAAGEAEDGACSPLFMIRTIFLLSSDSQAWKKCKLIADI